MIGWLLGLGALGLLAVEGVKRWRSAGGGGNPTAPGAAVDAKTRADFEHPPRFLASPMHMLQGQRYRVRYRDGDFAPASLLGNVKLYASEAALPADWPAETKGAQATSTRFGSGTWQRPTGEVDRPEGLLQIWPTLATE